jgi:sortase A
MVISRRGLAALILSVVALLCLVLLAITSSGAQAVVAQANGAVAVAGDNCLSPGTQNNGNQQVQQSQYENTNSQQTSQNGTGNNNNGTQSSQNGSQNSSTPQTQSNDQVQSQNGSNDVRQSQQTGDQQLQQNNSDQQPSQNGTQDNNNGSQQSQNGNNTNDTQQYQGNGTQSPSANNNAGNECVVASTVPNNDGLPPTGTSAKSSGSDTAKKETTSDHNGKSGGGNDAQKKTGGKTQGESDPPKKVEDYRGQKVELKDRSGNPQNKPGIVSSSGSSSRSGTSSNSGTGSKSGASSTSASKPDLAPVLARNWTSPSREEAASTDKLRRYAPSPDSAMTLSVRALGLYDVPVTTSNKTEALDNGLIHMPGTSLPGDGGHQKNVYIAGHYLGVPGTESRLVFYNLHKLKKGDELALKDSQGRVYRYKVSDTFEVGPQDSWVMGQVKNRDMLTLQTCIPPDFGKRLIVRANRV